MKLQVLKIRDLQLPVIIIYENDEKILFYCQERIAVMDKVTKEDIVLNEYCPNPLWDKELKNYYNK